MERSFDMIPEFLNSRICKDYDLEYVNLIKKGYGVKRPLTLRVNNLKVKLEWVLNYFLENGIEFERVSWYENALIIKNKQEDDLRKLDIYEKGYIYFQSLSSMLPPLFMDFKANDQILDMTAAPGGKTTELAALSNNSVLITAVEKNKIRVERLKYNIEKQGAKRVAILQTDARFLDEYFMFDKILLDAPCSGSGTLFLDEEISQKISEELILRSIEVQNTLLSNAIKHLKENGEIIYSTCSILKEENEKVLQAVLKDNPNIEIVPLNLDNYKDLPLLPVLLPGTLCVMPNEYYEGFFVAKLLKK